MSVPFSRRHIGITPEDLPEMLKVVGASSVDELIDQTIPTNIRLHERMRLPEAMSEQAYLNHVHALAQKNILCDNYIGMGYYGTNTPSVIMRNVFENPVWYTSYTPYQAEISQGRLEALLNFQTMVCDITGLSLTNCSLLDEATAAAEAMTMMYNLRSRDQVKANVNTLFVDEQIFPQTLAVLNTRALPPELNIMVGDFKTFNFPVRCFGALVQYPTLQGESEDLAAFKKK